TVGQALGEVVAQVRQIVVDHQMARHTDLVAIHQIVDAVVDRQRSERRDQAPLAGVAANRRQRAYRDRRQGGWRDCRGFHGSVRSLERCADGTLYRWWGAVSPPPPILAFSRPSSSA